MVLSPQEYKRNVGLMDHSLGPSCFSGESGENKLVNEASLMGNREGEGVMEAPSLSQNQLSSLHSPISFNLFPTKEPRPRLDRSLQCMHASTQAFSPLYFFSRTPSAKKYSPGASVVPANRDPIITEK